MLCRACSTRTEYTPEVRICCRLIGKEMLSFSLIRSPLPPLASKCGACNETLMVVLAGVIVILLAAAILAPLIYTFIAPKTSSTNATTEG